MVADQNKSKLTVCCKLLIWLAIGFSIIAGIVILHMRRSSSSEPTFPTHFKWSVHGSEQGFDHKGPSIWDRYVNQTHSDATYHNIDDVIRTIRNYGANQYEIPLSWSGLLPNGLTSKINEEAVDYYNDLISALLANDIEPVGILYHRDLPLSLADRGGWLNRASIDWFGNYSQFCFELFGPKVKSWITLDDPRSQATMGYCGDTVEIASGKFQETCEWSMYFAAHNMLLAHARAVQMYRSTAHEGQIGISLEGEWIEPDTVADREATEVAFEFQFGWFSHPILGSKGDYPPRMIQRMNQLAEEEGRVTSRLPKFTSEEIESLKGSVDFIGISYRTSLMASANLSSSGSHSREMEDMGVLLYPKPLGPIDSGIRSHPEGLVKILGYVKENYSNIPVLIGAWLQKSIWCKFDRKRPYYPKRPSVKRSASHERRIQRVRLHHH